MITQTQVKKSPPANNPPVALGLGDYGDWHIRVLLAQILGPVNNMAQIFNLKGITLRQLTIKG